MHLPWECLFLMVYLDFVFTYFKQSNSYFFTETVIVNILHEVPINNNIIVTYIVTIVTIIVIDLSNICYFHNFTI